MLTFIIKNIRMLQFGSFTIVFKTCAYLEIFSSTLLKYLPVLKSNGKTTKLQLIVQYKGLIKIFRQQNLMVALQKILTLYKSSDLSTKSCNLERKLYLNYILLNSIYSINFMFFYLKLGNFQRLLLIWSYYPIVIAASLLCNLIG